MAAADEGDGAGGGAARDVGVRELSDETLARQAETFTMLRQRNPSISLRAWMDGKDFTREDRNELVKLVTEREANATWGVTEDCTEGRTVLNSTLLSGSGSA